MAPIIVIASLALTSSCGGDDGVVTDPNDLVSLVVWVKGNGTSGGAIYAKSLVGDLATSDQGELFPQSTVKRMTPYLTKVVDADSAVTLFWVEQPTTSNIHGYGISKAGSTGDQVYVNDGAYASGPASDVPGGVWYSSNVSGDSEIYRKTLNGTPVRLTNKVGNDSAPDVNGDQVVFHSNSGNFEIYRMDSDTGAGLVNLTNDPSADLNPRFSPDRSKIVFASNRSGKYNIYMMNFDGSGLERLTTHSADDATPSFSADMKYVVYASRLDGDWDIYALDLQSRTETNLTNDTVDDRSPHCGRFQMP